MAKVIWQNSKRTEIKCPACKCKIVLTHGEGAAGSQPGNDLIGRLDLGEQNYQYIVCMNCEWAGDVRI